jgi:GNAT superfamily N-acetyltransferase
VDRHRVLELQRRGIEAWIPTLVHASPGAELLAVDGVVAALVPASPERSLVNGGVFDDIRGLRRALPVLAEAYDEAGVRASSLWMLEPDMEAEGLLERSGYRLDGEPAAMCLELAGFEAGELGGLDWDASATAEEVGLVNDLAYGYPEGQGVSPAIGEGPAGVPIRSYRARAGGAVAAVLQTLDLGSDCFVSWVATVPEQRGRGLASRLMRAALFEARERGLATSTLQSSMLGRGVYERLGYRMAFPLRLFERRPGAAD